MMQNPSSEADSLSDSQQNSSPVLEPESSLLCSQAADSGPL
jgi:hypothetical protein